MDESILSYIKDLIGINKNITNFDLNIISHINAAFMILTQLGVGPEKGFRIKDDSTLWSEFETDEATLDGVKDYIYLKTRLVFDPPTSSIVIESIKQMIAEYEFRLPIPKT